jgi:hypothetical protein
MKRDYIITSSARTMLSKVADGNICHLIFITDQSKIQEFSKQLNLSLLCGYHAYKIAEEAVPDKDVIFNSKILVELQFHNKADAQLIREMLLENGIESQMLDDMRTSKRQVAFEKGDRFSNNAL